MSKDPVDQRARMVELQLESRGIRDRGVLAALRKIPRHEFVPDDLFPHAYNDEPLPIGEGQTISQPYIVAYMTEALKLRHDSRILEIGTGSGYQTAVLAEIVEAVFTVEIISSLSTRAQGVLERIGFSNIQFRIGDGTHGWEEHAPFDGIMITAAPREVPEPLLDQLGPGGKMVLPVGETYQELVLLSRERKGIKRRSLIPVRFVPLISERDRRE